MSMFKKTLVFVDSGLGFRAYGFLCNTRLIWFWVGPIMIVTLVIVIRGDVTYLFFPIY